MAPEPRAIWAIRSSRPIISDTSRLPGNPGDRFVRSDDAAVPQHAYLIGDRHHLVELVTDKTIATPSALSRRRTANSAAASWSVIEAVGSSSNSTCAFERERLGDFDELHLRDGQRTHFRAYVDPRIE